MTTNKHNSLRALSKLVVLICAAGSFYFMFDVGRDFKSNLLIAFFTMWVLAPFLGLASLKMIFNKWKVSFRSVNWFLILLSIGSLIAYSGILARHDAKPALIFFVFPIISWMSIVVFFLISKGRVK